MLKHGACLALVSALFTLPVAAQSAEEIPLIPRPAAITAHPGHFVLKEKMTVSASPAFKEVAALFTAGELPGSFSWKAVPSAQPAKADIRFILTGSVNAADSAAYHLTITPKAIEISASGKAGALHGMQSLVQLLLQAKGQLPCVDIHDKPRFNWRGAHLDVSRNFYPTSYIKRFIDLMALYKLNTFHWHLTDGAGWRLEIKHYPELTRRAAWRTHRTWKEWWTSGRKYLSAGDPNAYGGFYTQVEAREIVAYAARRGITVIPEIEMPGHSEEVLAVYPQLSCSGQPYKNSEFCIGNDSTFTFLEDVLKEVMDIFPSSYIHIGGDEADKKAWHSCPECQQRMNTEHLKDEHELQSYAIRRMEKFLTTHQRRLLGWDEILEGGLAPQATVMSWRGESGGITAAKAGHDVVMTPGGYCYFDSYQADPATQPEAIGGYLPLEKVYSYEPVPESLTPAEARHVLGAQANTWVEYIPSPEHLEYMVFPRLLALSEVVWSPAAVRNWDHFRERLQQQYGLLQKLNVSYYRPAPVVTIHPQIDYLRKTTTIAFRSEQLRPVIRYTLDNSMPTASSALYTQPFEIHGSSVVKAAIFRDTVLQGKPAELAIDDHKAIGKTVIYNLPYSKGYPAKKDSTLVNGYRGGVSYGDGQWQGFEGKDMDVTIDLGVATAVNRVAVTFMQITGPGVYMPAFVEISVSDDGQHFTPVKQIPNDIPETQSTLTFKNFTADGLQVKTRYVRVKARNDKRGFLFADEIIIY